VLCYVWRVKLTSYSGGPVKATAAKLTLTLILLVNLPSALAKDILFKNSQDRINAIKNGRVWLAPEWIDSNFQFSDSLDVYNGPAVDAPYHLLFQDTVYCLTTPEDQQSSFGGKTPKFYCRLIDSMNSLFNPSQPTPLVAANGKTVKLKVKYPYAGGKPNNEIYGEVLGTRLLWALGFGADRMFYVSQMQCYGCSEDPFKTRSVDNSALAQARVFSPTAIELKMNGEKMIMQAAAQQSQQEDESQAETELSEGFSFKELMQNLPDDKNIQYAAYTQREALRLLAVFLQHLDLKPENQKILCPTAADASGNCPVQPILYIQDIGSSFGVSVKGFKLDKVNFKTWSSEKIWLDGTICQANFSRPFLKDSSMKNPIIAEAGRKFLVQLLDGFSAGEAGRKRVENLFRAARMDQRASRETIQMWVEAFYDRVKQIKYPAGDENPNFECPGD